MVSAEGTAGEWLSYFPPKSVAFGHQSRIRDARRAWSMTQRFLNHLTEFELGKGFVELCCTRRDHGVDEAVGSPRIEEARQRFGLDLDGHADYPRWRIGPSDLEAAIAFALDDDRYPKQSYGPTSLHFWYRFRWKEFEPIYRALPTDSSDRFCSLGISFGGQRLFLQPSLVVPASWDSQVAREFIARIEPDLPFRLRDQYFRRMFLTRGNHGSSKLSKTWRSTPIAFRPQ
jgi:hypothetical protein